MQVAERKDSFLMRENRFAALLLSPCDPVTRSDPNRALFASLLTGQSLGLGCLPATLGLSQPDFVELLAHYFPNAEFIPNQREGESIPEWDDLNNLLLNLRAHERNSETWVAAILATACAGRDHLWQDLGLANRDELSRLMWVNFPQLAATNTGDMKWKKFLYKQLCEREGIYVCPAPSCGVCADHAKCFAPET